MSVRIVAIWTGIAVYFALAGAVIAGVDPVVSNPLIWPVVVAGPAILFALLALSARVSTPYVATWAVPAGAVMLVSDALPPPLDWVAWGLATAFVLIVNWSERAADWWWTRVGSRFEH